MFRKFLVVLVFLLYPVLFVSCGGVDGGGANEVEARTHNYPGQPHTELAKESRA